MKLYLQLQHRGGKQYQDIWFSFYCAGTLREIGISRSCKGSWISYTSSADPCVYCVLECNLVRNVDSFITVTPANRCAIHDIASLNCSTLVGERFVVCANTHYSRCWTDLYTYACMHCYTTVNMY